MSKVRDILGVDKESEFLQSFVRVGLTADQEDHEPHKSLYMQPRAPPVVKQSSEIRSEGSGGRSPTRTRTSPGRGAENGRARRTRRRDYFEEMYTDKDRAAAVSYGCYPFLSSNNSIYSESNESRAQVNKLKWQKKSNSRLFSFIFTTMAVFTGYFDIKQSLSIKRRQDRSEALQLPDETDPSTLLGLGQREFKSGNTEIAILFISKACID